MAAESHWVVVVAVDNETAQKYLLYNSGIGSGANLARMSIRHPYIYI